MMQPTVPAPWSEILGVLYQVTDATSALEMALDSYFYFFGLQHLGILCFDENEERYLLSTGRNLEAPVQKHLYLQSGMVINGINVQEDHLSQHPIEAGEIKFNDLSLKISDTYASLILLPFRFQEQTSAFLMLLLNRQENELFEQKQSDIEVYSQFLAPLMYHFSSRSKKETGPENIINKIIRDRIQEAQVGMYPVSFAVFRLSLEQEILSTILLKDTIDGCQQIFKEKISSYGDLLWLTLDTVLFIFPNADLFAIESLCHSLKDELESVLSSEENTQVHVRLKYVCISYPQSGSEAGDVLNQLWLRLFDDWRMELNQV